MKLNLDSVPGSFDAAVSALAASLTDDDRDMLRKHEGAEEAAVCAHSAGGRYIRNAWSMWESDTPLMREMKGRGLFHADDVSGAILRAAISPLFGESFDLDTYVRRCREFWLSSGVDPDTGEKIP